GNAGRRCPFSDRGGEPGPAAADPGPGQKDEQDELRGQRAGPVRRRRLGWRTLVATILIVIGCLLAPVSVLAVWAANEVGNTDRYVATMEPLAHNPAIQNALTDKITTRLNVTSDADQAAAELSSRGLPKVSALLKSVAPSIASGVAGFIHSEVHKIVTGPRFAQAWVRANTVPSGAGEGAVGPGGQLGQRQERPGRRGPGPVHRRCQAGPGQPRLHPRQQDPGHQPDADPVLGQVPGQGAIRLPADQRSQDRAADPDAAAAGLRRVRRPRPPPRPDRRWARPRRVDAGARRRAVDLPRHLPGQRA